MDTFLQDLRYALRTLFQKGWAFTALAVLALALGIGANTAIFSAVDAVLLKPLRFKDPDRLVTLYHSYPKLDLERASLSPIGLFTYREDAKSFSSIAAITGYRTPENLTGGGEPERVRSAAATANFFATLGVDPALGRGFLEGEDEAGRNRVAVLSNGLWRRRYGADPAIVGKSVALDGVAYAVVGVMPPGFRFLYDADVWVPLAFTPEMRQDGGEYMDGVARLAPGVTLEQARAEMAALSERIAAQFEFLRDSGWHVVLDPLREILVGDMRPRLLILLGAVGLVLLIACANVANLLLARAAAREREIAIRSALGAGRRRLLRQLLTESVMLALLGGGLGLLLAYRGVPLLMSLLPADLAGGMDVRLDLRVLLFTLLVAVATGLAFGLLPAFHLSRPDHSSSFKEGAQGSTPGSGRNRARSALVVSEVALALMLLIGAGLLLRSFSRLQEVDPGFPTSNLLTLRLSLPESKYGEDAQVTAFYQRLLERVAALPGVTAAGAVSGLPLSGNRATSSYELEGRPVGPGEAGPHGSPRLASPGYFRALGIPLLEGRLPTEQDGTDAPPVAVIDELVAKQYWPEGGPHGDPIGKRLRFYFEGSDEAPHWREIVGVVRHVKNDDLATESKGQIYLPLLQRPERGMALAVRTNGDPLAAAAAVRAQVLELDRDQPVYDVAAMTALVDRTLATSRFSTLLLAIFAGVASVLAAVGIYGVMAYSVTQRRHEIGIRMALGAARDDVLRLIVGQGALLAAAGLGLGLLGAFFAARLLSGLLFGVSAADPVVFATVPLLLAAIALLASYIPARRATQVDPQVALRSD